MVNRRKLRLNKNSKPLVYFEIMTRLVPKNRETIEIMILDNFLLDCFNFKNLHLGPFKAPNCAKLSKYPGC